MICLLLSLFMAILCFILITVPAGRDRIRCQALAALVQYFFLASSMWSNAMAFNIRKTLYAMSLSASRRSKLKFYVPYAMGCPLVCVLVAVTLSRCEIKAFDHPVHREVFVCFLHEKITLYATFLIYAAIAVYVILGVIAIARGAQSGGLTTFDKHRRQKNVITGIKLSLCLGLGWAFLFIAKITEDIDWYTYMQIFVELQGVLVVLANLLSWNCIISAKTWTTSFFSTRQPLLPHQ